MSKKRGIAEQLAEGIKEHIHRHSSEKEGVPQVWGKPKMKDLQLEDCKAFIQQCIDFLEGCTKITEGVSLKSEHKLVISVELDKKTIVISFADPAPSASVSYIINFDSKIPEIRANTEEVIVNLAGLLTPNPHFKVVS